MDSRKIELYHGSGQIVEFPEIRKQDIQKIFPGDFTVRKVMNRHIDGRNANMNRELSIFTHTLKMRN